MKRQFWRLLLMAAVMSLIFMTKVWGQDAALQGHSVAVLPFEVDAEQFGEMGRDLQTLLTAHLSSDPQIILVERAEVDKALSELEMGISGTVDPDTAAKIGYITGAQILVTGRSFAVQKELVTVAKIVGVETSRVYGQTSTMPLRGSVVEMSVELAEKIKVLTKSLSASVKTVTQIEAEINERRKLVDELVASAETAKRLGNLNRQEVEAVAQALEGRLKKEEDRTFWIRQVWAIVYVLLGIALAEIFRYVRNRRKHG